VLPTLISWLRRGADTVGALLFLVTFTGLIIQVFYRYILNSPVAWSEEFTMIAYMWAVFWAAAFMVRERDHVSFDIVYDAVSPRIRRLLAIGSLTVLVIAFLLLLAPTWDYLEFLTRK
jgi:TRAP-type C4-dicarboxylate transport system permease small subunit